MAQKAASCLFWLLRCSQYLLWSSQHPSLSFSRNRPPATPGSTDTFWEAHTLPCTCELVHDSLLCLLADNHLKTSRNHHSCLFLHQDQLSGSELAQQPWGSVPPQSWGQWEDKFPQSPNLNCPVPHTAAPGPVTFFVSSTQHSHSHPSYAFSYWYLVCLRPQKQEPPLSGSRCPPGPSTQK